MAQLPDYSFRECPGLERTGRVVAYADLQKTLAARDQGGQSGKYPNEAGSALKGGWTS